MSRTAQPARFLAVGAANFALSLPIYQLLLFALPPWASYTLTFSFSTAFGYWANARFTFAALIARDRAALFAATQVAAAAAGSLGVEALAAAGISPRIGVFLVVGLTTPVNFLAARWAIAGGRSAR